MNILPKLCQNSVVLVHKLIVQKSGIILGEWESMRYVRTYPIKYTRMLVNIPFVVILLFLAYSYYSFAHTHHGYCTSAGATVRLLQRPYYGDVIMDAMASQITNLTIVYSTTYLGTDKRKHQSSADLCAGNPLVTGEFPAQMASDAENVSIWWRHQ